MGYGAVRGLPDRVDMISLIRTMVDRGMDFFDTAGPLPSGGSACRPPPPALWATFTRWANVNQATVTGTSVEVRMAWL
jgi:hypothetical protein